jgi:uncharacterized protein
MNAPSHRGAPSYWTGKVALVTGGSSGLGRAIAVELARQGARVIIAARGSSAIDTVVNEMRATGAEVLGIAADVTRQADVDRLVDETVTRFGGLDVLVNAVGRSARGAALSTTPEEFAALLELNLLAAVRMTGAAGPHLLRSRGHLINIGSLAAKFAGRFMGGYSASKFALGGYTQQLRLELAGDGLKVLLVCPGPIVRDEVRHYETADPALPTSARQPGAGIRVRGMAADDIARRVLRAAEHDRAELILPARARLVFVAAAISPRLGQWLVQRFA